MRRKRLCRDKKGRFLPERICKRRNLSMSGTSGTKRKKRRAKARFTLSADGCRDKDGAFVPVAQCVIKRRRI